MPQCVCTFSEKNPVPDRKGWYRYHYRCVWKAALGDRADMVDRNSYVVAVETDKGDAAALALAKEECPYEVHRRET